MEIKNLKENEKYIIRELYDKHKNDFYEPITLEEFCEQFCNRCHNCKRIKFIDDLCEECDTLEYIEDFHEFEENKEHILYGI